MIPDLWYKHAVIYNLHVNTFMDGNGDGIGDFEGLIRQVDYLYSLGVDVVWLAPFQPSPQKDNGYDVSEYYGVEPHYGSLGDFVEFLNVAKNRGIKVIMDLVVNHTSNEHPWFQEARQDEDSSYRDWYVWAEQPPKDWKMESAFPGVVDGTWTYDEQASAYYFHRFYPFQPDLNMDNPDVRTEIHRIMGFWLQLDVLGFRVDAVPFMLESFNLDNGEQTKRFDYIHELRDFLQWRQGDAILLGEVNVPPENVKKYFGTKDEVLHMMFNFHVNQHLFYALATGKVHTLIDALENTRLTGSEPQWAYFLRNHDELSLDQLSEEQQAEVFAAFGPEEEMQLYGRGIRRRLAPMLGERQRLELAYSVLFALPGTPVIYYGEEIGMGDNLKLHERNSVRTPMQWANEPQGGFSKADKLVRPIIDEGPYNCEHVNVEDQRRQSDSFLNWISHMIRLRQEAPEIGWGQWEILDSGSASVLALRYDWRGNCLVTLHNFSDQPQKVKLNPGVEGADALFSLLEKVHHQADKSGYHKFTLDPYGYQWYRVGNLHYIADRQRG
jgi:maltose alpha-D-glucosyltransferase/alpha-amylase